MIIQIVILYKKMKKIIINIIIKYQNEMKFSNLIIKCFYIYFSNLLFRHSKASLLTK